MTEKQSQNRGFDDFFYTNLPKVELHRHLEGSLSVDVLFEIAQTYGLDIPSPNHLRSMVQVNPGEPYTSKNFLEKFRALRQFYQSPEIISQLTHQVVADAAADRIRYLELRFTPVALSAVQGFSISDVMDWVLQSARQAGEAYGITVRLIASVNRHESVKTAEKVVQHALERRASGIVALDLAGNEAQFPAQPFAGLFREAQQAGLHITLHAGEWGGADHVAEALRDFRAERIGHGVRVMEDPAVVELARARRIAFEVCLTSNYQSGVVQSLQAHPLRSMQAAGLNVTLATDDPSISAVTLGDEYRIACEELNISRIELRHLILAAATAAFLPESEKNALLVDLEAEINPLLLA